MEARAVAIAPGAYGVVGASGLMSAVPPRSEAGFVHSARYWLPVGDAERAAVAVPGRPKMGSGGTGASNVEYAITQPNCRCFRHAGTCLKSPPTSCPLRTTTFAPRRTADTSFVRTAGR